MSPAMKTFVVRSENPDGSEWRETTLQAEDKDEARFQVETSNRDLAKSASAPESKPYRIASVKAQE